MRPLLKLRQAFFRTQTSELYKSYVNAFLPPAVLFTPALIKAPTAVARPILAWRDHPLDLHANFLLLLAWFCSVIIWARIHRSFVRGGALPVFARTAPIPAMTLRLIDGWMLLTGMCLFLIPFAVSAYVSVTASTDGDARFPWYFALLLAATLSVAKDVIYGMRRIARGSHLLTLLVLFSPPPLDPLLRHPVLIGVAALLELANFLSARVDPMRTHRGRMARLQERFAAYPVLIHMATNYARFLGAHHLLSRILWSLLPLGFAWWLIEEAGNRRDAPMILHLAFGAFVGILSGAYKVLLDGREKLTRFARSTAYGGRMLALFDHLLVLTPGVLCSTVWLAALSTLGMFSKLHLLALSGFYLSVLALLGLQWIQRHRHVVQITYFVAGVSTAIAANFI